MDTTPDGSTDGPTDGRDNRLAMAAAAAVVAVLVWNVGFLAPVLLPLRLFTTFAHEAWHGLAAILTGGDFVRFEVAVNGSGVAWTAGGWRWLVLPAGYLGAALTATVLVVAAHRARDPRLVASFLAAGIALVAIVFGWLSLVALVVGLGTAIALFALARYGSVTTAVLALDTAGFLAGWSTVLDLVGILRSPGSSNGAVLNDAAAFGQHVGIGGGRLWAFVWLLVAVAVLVPAVRAVASSIPARAGTPG